MALLVLLAVLVVPGLQRQSTVRVAKGARFSEIVETAWPQRQFRHYIDTMPRGELIAVPVAGLMIDDRPMSAPVDALIVLRGPVRLSPLRRASMDKSLVDGIVLDSTIANEYHVHSMQRVTVSGPPGTYGNWHVSAVIDSITRTPVALWSGVSAVIWDSPSAWSLIRSFPGNQELPVWIITGSKSPPKSIVMGSAGQLVLSKATLLTRMLRSITVNPDGAALSVLLLLAALMWVVRNPRAQWVEWLVGSALVVFGVGFLAFVRGLRGFTLIPISVGALMARQAGSLILLWLVASGARRLTTARSRTKRRNERRTPVDSSGWKDFDPLS